MAVAIGRRPPQHRRFGLRACALHLPRFYASAFPRKLYRTMEEIQVDVDARLESYNAERTHSGKYCYGKDRFATFIESAPLAHQKQLDRIGHTTDLTTAAS